MWFQILEVRLGTSPKETSIFGTWAPKPRFLRTSRKFRHVAPVAKKPEATFVNQLSICLASLVAVFFRQQAQHHGTP